MAQHAVVTIETAFQFFVEIPNRVSRTAFSCARQSAQVMLARQAVPPSATVVFEDYVILDEDPYFYFSWNTSGPVSTCWRYRHFGHADEWIVIPAPAPATLTTFHIVPLAGPYDLDIEYEFVPYGADIEGVLHYGAAIHFTKHSTGGKIIEDPFLHEP